MMRNSGSSAGMDWRHEGGGTTRCLSFHAGYLCAHSGACCTSGWTIPVEPPQLARLDAALRDGRLRVPRDGGGLIGEAKADAPRDPLVPAALLRADASGACACYDRAARRCAIHGQLGHDALPVSCQIFPRVCLIDRDGAYLTLSHYCPTAAGLLVAAAAAHPPVATPTAAMPADPVVVDAPDGFAPMPLEGLDARDALPPLLHPAMLADRDAYRCWERWVVATLCEGQAADGSLHRIIDVTESIRRWRPRDGSLTAAVEAAFASATDETSSARRLPPAPALTPGALALDAAARRAVLPGLGVPSVPPDVVETFELSVAPAWSDFAAPVGRYLAARAFASWCAYQGRGLRTVVCSVVTAHAVLRVEAARHCAEAGRALDERLLLEAVRSADLLLVHLASREELARAFGDVEDESAEDLRRAV
jgi:hypothetical protein